MQNPKAPFSPVPLAVKALGRNQQATVSEVIREGLGLGLKFRG